MSGCRRQEELEPWRSHQPCRMLHGWQAVIESTHAVALPRPHPFCRVRTQFQAGHHQTFHHARADIMFRAAMLAATLCGQYHFMHDA